MEQTKSNQYDLIIDILSKMVGKCLIKNGVITEKYTCDKGDAK